MTTFNSTIQFNTDKEGDIVLLDNFVYNNIRESNINTGIVTLFVPGSTGALTTIEFERGLVEDFPKTLDNLIPKNNPYKHNQLNYDDNGHSHIKASIIGPSITIPLINGSLSLGTWQQIVFLELDTHARNRKIVIMILGDI